MPVTADPLESTPGPGRLAEPRRNAWGISLLIFALAFICFIPLPTDVPLAGTEGHRALTAHEMVTTGEWVVPRLYGRVYLRKPALHYWIEAAFEKVAGRGTPFIWRLPSAVEAAALAAILCLFSARWFGHVAAGIVSGLSYVALFTLWGENRGADIDISNTFFSTIAALALVELYFRDPSRPWCWAILAGAAIAGSMLVKFHAGMTIILGVWLWAAISAWRNGRHADFFKRPFTWAPLAIGILSFILYGLATYAYLKAHAMTVDFSGLSEATEDIHLHSHQLRYLMEWLLLPATMFVYSMPVSLSLPLAFSRHLRPADQTAARTRHALAASVLIAWGICLVSGMHLPRYAFVTLPLLCPLAGALAHVATQVSPGVQARLRWSAAGSLLAVAGLAVVLCATAWKTRSARPLTTTIAILAMGVSLSVGRSILGGFAWPHAWGAAAVLLLASVNFGVNFSQDRWARSSLPQGRWLRGQVGPDGPIYACEAIQREPELFYYAGIPTIGVDGDEFDWRLMKTSGWVVLEPLEMKRWQTQVPERLTRVTPFVANRNPAHVLWYQLPATATQPTTHH
jgi:4-amino-4-deoxy-L-arabinose transferase-like glycosyltransferase